ncbi:dihydroneopterin aldolase [Helicobacter mesocricetorum]|uniref:dihydroneopterin aldolase n=1 Tax=Helicobacter mesocricetorum TaxID=87012 RepID=UPI000CF02EC0|nr:dihydroneopterin aldolase [Helicobacter mesocricetorum]
MHYEIALENFRFEAILGILPFERTNKQKIQIDSYFTYHTHSKNDFLDYRLLKNFLRDSFEQNFRLLEEVLMYFFEEIPKRFPQITSFCIKITKLEIFNDCKVSMQIQYPKEYNGINN